MGKSIFFCKVWGCVNFEFFLQIRQRATRNPPSLRPKRVTRGQDQPVKQSWSGRDRNDPKLLRTVHKILTRRVTARLEVSGHTSTLRRKRDPLVKNIFFVILRVVNFTFFCDCQLLCLVMQTIYPTFDRFFHCVCKGRLVFGPFNSCQGVKNITKLPSPVRVCVVIE